MKKRNTTFLRAAESLFEEYEQGRQVGCCEQIGKAPLHYDVPEEKQFFRDMFSPPRHGLYWWEDGWLPCTTNKEARILALLLADILFQEHLSNKSK